MIDEKEKLEGNEVIGSFMEEVVWECWKKNFYKRYWASVYPTKEACEKGMSDYAESNIERHLAYVATFLADYEAKPIYKDYSTSWEELMPVFRKINGLGKGFSTAIFKHYIAITVEKGGKMYKDFSFAHSEYILPEQTDKEAAFKILVKFIKWFKSKPLEVSD